MPTTPERRGARRQERLTHQRIVEAALALIDEQGMAAVTMRTLAARLHVEAMSLYKHVANRDKLFDAVVERIVGELAEYDEVSAEPTEGWRSYLADIAHGVRRYARAHPHAFPLVATRPTEAPWINPPLRSVDWIEAFLRGLEAEGFSDEEVLFAYRSFNSFLLGFLLLETSAMAIGDPRPGDGAYASPHTVGSDTVGSDEAGSDEAGSDEAGSDEAGSDEATAAEAAVPGGLTPTRSRADRRAVAQAGTAEELIDPQGEVDPARYPTIHRLAEGLAEDHFEAEFQLGLDAMLDKIAEARSYIAGRRS